MIEADFAEKRAGRENTDGLTVTRPPSCGEDLCWNEALDTLGKSTKPISEYIKGLLFHTGYCSIAA